MNIHVLENGAAAQQLIEQVKANVADHQFIASGEASESPYHAWRCAFYLGRTTDRSAYTLVMHDFGDPSEGVGKPYIETVAAATEVDGADENTIVRALMKAHEASGGNYIEMYHRIGDFDLEEEADE